MRPRSRAGVRLDPRRSRRLNGQRRGAHRARDTLCSKQLARWWSRDSYLPVRSRVPRSQTLSRRFVRLISCARSSRRSLASPRRGLAAVRAHAATRPDTLDLGPSARRIVSGARVGTCGGRLFWVGRLRGRIHPTPPRTRSEHRSSSPPGLWWTITLAQAAHAASQHLHPSQLTPRDGNHQMNYGRRQAPHSSSV